VHPDRVIRSEVTKLTDLPNIGPSMAKTLRSIGINDPSELEGKDAFELYMKLCEKSGKRQDPCVLDVFLSIVDFANGAEPKVWWEFTGERKKRFRL